MNQLMQDFHDNFFELVGGSIAAGHHFLFASADHGLLLGIMRSMAIGMGTAYGIRTLNFITTFFITSIKSITMKQLLAFFTFLVVIATTLQGFVPQLPITDPNTAKYISAGLLFAVLVFHIHDLHGFLVKNKSNLTSLTRYEQPNQSERGSSNVSLPD